MKKITLVLLIIALITACTPGDVLSDEERDATAVAQTVEADPDTVIVLPEDDDPSPTPDDDDEVVIVVPEDDETPLPTATPQPTTTPRPTDTPQPTTTPNPSATPDASPTSDPSNTPGPTNTPAGTATPTPTPRPTSDPDYAGFTTGDLATPDLPDLVIDDATIPDFSCESTGGAPRVEVIDQVGGSGYLCLRDYPVSDVSVVRLETESGVNYYFAEFYTVDDTVYGPNDDEQGRITDGDGWVIWIHVPAWFTQGTWELTAQMNDGTRESRTTFNAGNAPFISLSALDPLPGNPLVFPYELSARGATEEEDALQFAPGDDIFFGGANYPANDTVIVALYTVNADGGLSGIAATEVPTNENGQWETSYIFPADATPGEYVIATNPTEGEAVTPFNGYFELING